jgi:hypothetical protein
MEERSQDSKYICNIDNKSGIILFSYCGINADSIVTDKLSNTYRFNSPSSSKLVDDIPIECVINGSGLPDGGKENLRHMGVRTVLDRLNMVLHDYAQVKLMYEDHNNDLNMDHVKRYTTNNTEFISANTSSAVQSDSSKKSDESNEEVLVLDNKSSESWADDKDLEDGIEIQDKKESRDIERIISSSIPINKNTIFHLIFLYHSDKNDKNGKMSLKSDENKKQSNHAHDENHSFPTRSIPTYNNQRNVGNVRRGYSGRRFNTKANFPRRDIKFADN